MRHDCDGWCCAICSEPATALAGIDGGCSLSDHCGGYGLHPSVSSVGVAVDWPGLTWQWPNALVCFLGDVGRYFPQVSCSDVTCRGVGLYFEPFLEFALGWPDFVGGWLSLRLRLCRTALDELRGGGL